MPSIMLIHVIRECIRRIADLRVHNSKVSKYLKINVIN